MNELIAWIKGHPAIAGVGAVALVGGWWYFSHRAASTASTGVTIPTSTGATSDTATPSPNATGTTTTTGTGTTTTPTSGTKPPHKIVRTPHTKRPTPIPPGPAPIVTSVPPTGPTPNPATVAAALASTTAANPAYGSYVSFLLANDPGSAESLVGAQGQPLTLTTDATPEQIAQTQATIAAQQAAA